MKKLLTLFLVLVLIVLVGNATLAGTSNSNGLMVGFQLSQETISKTTDITGGSYLYINPLFILNPSFALNVRYATDIAPNSFSDHILSVTPQFAIKRYGESQEYQMYAGLSYMTNFKNSYYGAKFCPVSMRQQNSMIEMLPVSFHYSPTTSDYVITFELISVGFYF